MQTIKRLFAFTALAVIFSAVAFAQTASVQGTVLDKSGAVVAAAQVSARNLATNQTSSAITSGSGYFSIPNLAVGDYEIKIGKESFKTFIVKSLELTVAQTQTVNAELEPGSVTEEVQVRADELPPVDLETSQVSNLVDARQIKDLPLITRDPYSLVLLSPGTSQTNSRLGGFTVNGARERNNNFLLDGVDNNDTSVPGIAGGVLSANPDSTEEFRVITNNFNAEYGRNTGAIIDVVTKGGTNSFHGGVYEFGRWNAFGGARDWFNPAIDASGNKTKQDPYVRNQFGYSIGGPIIKNKTFFFFNEEFQRFRTTLTNNATVPTAAFKTGVFNYFGAPVDLNGANNGTPTIFQQFGIPVTLPAAPADPTAQKLFSLYPNPTLDNGDGLTGTLFFPSGSQQNSYQTVARIDHKITNKHSFSGRYGYDHSFDPNPFHDDILPGNVGGVSSKAINQGLSANLTSTLSNSLINSFTFGWNKIYANFGCTGLSGVDAATPALDQFGYGWDFTLDPFTSFGCTALGGSNGQWRKTGTTSYTDFVSLVHGNHTMKFGGDFRNVGEQGPDSFFSRRQVSLDTAFIFGASFVQGVPTDDLALEDAAAAYYGLVGNDFNAEFFNKSTARQSTDNKRFRQHEYDWFGQDSWKIRPNLTLTMGLRYQLDGVPYEENANFSNLFTSAASFPVVMTIVGPGTGKQLYSPDHSNIEPRLGFSWDPFKDGKTAVRGAFGIFHDRVFGNLFGNARGNPPFEQDYNQFPLDSMAGFYGGALNGPFPLVVPATNPSPTIPDGSQLAPTLFDPHFRNTASNNWNFGIQRELPGNYTVDLSYVGSKGTYIYRAVDGNPPDPALVAQLVAFCSDPTNAFGCTPATVSSTRLYNGADNGLLPFNAVAHNALLQPAVNRAVGNSNYNAMQLKINHRLSHGIQVQGAYTWAHGLDDSPDPIDPAQGNRTFPRNSRNLAQDYGNSDNDIRHVLVINYVWELPFGKGKGFLNSGVVGKVFEGMQFSGITSVQGGHPFEIRSTRDSQRTGISAWADLVANPNAAGANDTSHNKIYFRNPDAFVNPNFGGPGNIGRNQFYGPGFVNFDLVWSKVTSLGERFKLETRVEGYNIFNHPHFQQPDNLISDSTFGQILSTASRPDATTSARQMQVALKLNF